MERKTHMKKTVFALALAATIAAATAHADLGPMEQRRTLFVTFGQKNIILEAPASMCFLNPSDPMEGATFSYMRAATASQGLGTLMAVFTDCMQISSLKSGSADLSTVDKGTITWMHSLQPDASITRATYLDTRAGTLTTEVARGLERMRGAKVDSEVRRNDAGASVGFYIPLELDFKKMTATGVTTAMMLRGMPVDVSFSRMSAHGPGNLDVLYDMMGTFAAQQVALNPQAN
jgi:hypothetical protein